MNQDKEMIEIKQFLKTEELNRKQGRKSIADKEYYKIVLLEKILEKLDFIGGCVIDVENTIDRISR